MHLNTGWICVLDTNKVGLHLSFTCVYSLYPMLPGEVTRSSAPSCLIFLDPQVQTALCSAVLHSGVGTLADLRLYGEDHPRRKMPLSHVLERGKWWDVVLGEDISLRSEWVTTSRLVLGRVFSGEGGRFSLRWSLNPLCWSRASGWRQWRFQKWMRYPFQD